MFLNITTRIQLSNQNLRKHGVKLSEIHVVERGENGGKGVTGKEKGKRSTPGADLQTLDHI